MSALLDTLITKYGDALIAALVGCAIAWIKVLTDRATARKVIAESAVRQAVDMHDDSPEADQAAADELQRIPRKFRPKDVQRAVSKAMERERAVRASMRPPAEQDVIAFPPRSRHATAALGHPVAELDDDEDRRDTERVPPPEPDKP